MRRRHDFAAAVRRGRRAGRPSLVVHLLHGTQPGPDPDRLVARPADAGGPARTVRIGFVVGRSVGGAVTRNAVRRRLRYLIMERLERLPAGALVVVRALPSAAEAPTAQLAEDLDAALGRLVRGVPCTPDRLDQASQSNLGGTS